MTKKWLKRLLFPLLQRRDPEAWSITRFVQWASTQVADRALLLDAGAGDCKYQIYFSHTQYESTDFGDVFDKSARGKHTFVCDLTSITRPSNTYDAVLCTQVLEHVPDPRAVLGELYRVLKPGGQLFLTIPQGYGVHGAPYNFFNFTSFGIEHLLTQVGFDVKFIQPRGGIFWLLAKIMQLLPSYLSWQSTSIDSILKRMIKTVLFFLPSGILKVFIPLLLFPLDRFDHKKTWTLGYACYSRKP